MNPKSVLIATLLFITCLSCIDHAFAKENRNESSKAQKVKVPRVGAMDSSKTENKNITKKLNLLESSSDFNWSIEHLVSALQVISEYEAYALEHYQTTSLAGRTAKDQSDYQAQVKKLERLQLDLDKILSNAMHESANKKNSGFNSLKQPETDVSQRINNFTQAVNLLLQIQDKLAEFSLTEYHDYLLEIYRTHAIDLLKKVDKLHSDSSLYFPSSNRLLSGRSFTEALFGISTRVQLTDYLTAQSQRANYLAINYAETLVTFILNISTQVNDEKLVNKWKNTLVVLHKQRNKELENAQNQIEELIAVQLSNTNKSNCLSKTKLFQTKQENDIFSESINRIIVSAKSYCESLHAKAL